MLKLRIFKDNEEVCQIRPEKKLYRLGRSSEADITFNDISLSSIHCLLRERNGRWEIEDSSKNGITFERSKIADSSLPMKLNCKYELSRRISIEMSDQKGLDPQTIVRPKDRTKLILLDAQGDRIKVGRAKIKVLDGGLNQIYCLEDESLSIGSHPANDIVLEDEAVSQFHARIDQSQNSFFLTDLSSTNGTFLSENKIIKAKLSEKDQIKIGRFNLEFFVESEDREISTKNYDSFFGMLSRETKMRKIFSLAEAVATTEAPVFVHGETGTGKELLARAIHELSNRSSRDFIALNCAALPKELMESELFGHEKGAFTGAMESRIGAFEAADGGSIFLDEVGEMDLSLQAKLLRALETGEIKRIGSQKTRLTSVRVISATHRDLQQMIRQGKFREDLYYRLHVVPIHLPPLRERPKDLAVLVPELLQRMRIKFEVSPQALDFLKSYSFPGNIRELKNILQRAYLESRLQSLNEIDLSCFQFMQASKTNSSKLKAKDRQKRQEILDSLKKNAYSQTRTAAFMNMPISTLHDQIKRLGIDIRELKKEAS